MLSPKRTKFRKMQKGNNRGIAWRLWIRIFPDHPVTKKPLEVRMGGGKGAPEEWAAVVEPGRVMYEISGVTEDVAREAFRLATHKLPVATRVLIRGAL